MLPSTFAPYVLAYICADDARTLADKAAIGTAGEPSDLTAEAEAEEALEHMKGLNPEVASSLKFFIERPLDADDQTMEDLSMGASTVVVVDTRAGRAAAVCSFLHERLIAKRRGALDAMKEGFRHAADLRAALQLFSTQELADRFVRTRGPHSLAPKGSV